MSTSSLFYKDKYAVSTNVPSIFCVLVFIENDCLRALLVRFSFFVSFFTFYYFETVRVDK